MTRRNFNKIVLNTTLSLYKKPRDARDMKTSIVHLSSPKIEPVTDEMMDNLDFTLHHWKTGDKFYKLAHKFYGDSRLWWVIALYNLKPTDSHFKIGDTILIPTPIERVLTLYGF